MSRGLIVLTLMLFVGQGQRAMGATPCVDLQDMACRNQFIENNLPVPHLPSAEDLKELDELIAKINAEQRDETVNGANIKEATETHDGAALAEATKKEFEIRKRMYIDCDLAILDAEAAYGLKPKITEPISHGDSSPPALTKAWLPHFGEFDTRGNRVSADNEDMTAATNLATANMTVFPGSFKSSKQLAESIYHETVHWLNDNALGRVPSPYEDFSNEVFAYQKQLDTRTQFGLSEGQVGKITMRQSGYKERLKGVSKSETWREYMIDHPNAQLSGAIDTPAGSDPDDEDGLQNDLEGVVAGEIRRTHEEAGKEGDELRRMRDDDLRTTLGDMALKSCDAPGSVSQAELNDLSAPYFPSFIARYPANLQSSCARSIYSYLSTHLDNSEQLSAQDITDVAGRMQPIQLPSRSAIPDHLPVTTPPPTLPPAGPTPEQIQAEEHRKLIASLDNSVSIARNFLKAACQNAAGLTQADYDQFNLAVPFIGMYGKEDGYGRATIISGLGPCEINLFSDYYNVPVGYYYLNRVRWVVSEYWRRQMPAPHPHGDDGPKKRCGQDGSDPSWCTP